VFLLRKIWAIYAVMLFLVLMTLSLPVIGLNMIFTPGPRALRRNIRYLHHIFTPTFLALIGIRLRIEGAEHLDQARSYVIVGNHRSSLDFIVNAAAFPGVYRYLAKQELQKIPVFGWVVKKMCLIVDRSSAISRARSVVNLKQQLAEGWSIFIYPEGSRNKTEDALGTFHDGAFRIAIQTGAPLAIQTLVNVRDVISPTRLVDLRPGVLRIIWEQPIETSDLKQEDVSALKERVRGLMESRMSNN
jgi:1-acyl-sn-glycerol-3-phosphate acyltransferase